MEPNLPGLPPYQPPSGQEQTTWLKAALVTLLLIFSISLLGWKLYPYLAYRLMPKLVHRSEHSTRNTLREAPVDPAKERAMAALLETKYSRIDDHEKWLSVLYEQRDFTAVENEASDLLKDRNDEAKGYDLFLLYQNLAYVETDRDIEFKKDVLDEWCNKNPKSHTAWLVRGAFNIHCAWHMRGGDWAKNVQKDAWPKFEAKLEQARADLENSYRLNPDDPNSSCNLLIVARGRGDPREKMEEYFQNATTACPFHFGAHYHKLNYLMPKWHGTLQEMQKFSMECMKFADEHPYMGLIAVAALNEVHARSSENENYLGRNDVWPVVEKMYSNFFSKYPENIRRRLYYAYHAYKAKKYDIATKQFEIIGDRWMKGTSWDTLDRFNRCRAHAYVAYAITLPADQAVVYLRKSAELNPTKKTTYFNLGTFAAKLGQYEEAEAAFLKALEMDPFDAEAHLRLSWVYGKTNNPVKAKECAEKALRCRPTEEQRRTAKNYIATCDKALK